MYVSFTGHQNKLANQNDLEKVATDYPGATWVHGGAIGFDRQVEMFARSHGIKTIVIRPDYQQFGKRAPLVRNDEILNLGDLLVALYDGRLSGGTYYTVKKAKSENKRVIILEI